MKENLTSSRETQYRVSLELDVSSERCIATLLSLMSKGKRGWYVTNNHRHLEAYLGEDWHRCVVNYKDFNQVVAGSFKVRLRKKGRLSILRIAFLREKCVKSA